MLLAYAAIAIVSSCGDESISLSGEEVPRTSLPRVTLTTANNEEITRKTINAEIMMESASGTINMSKPVTVKGRGNISWWDAPKKSYTFFLKEGDGVLSMDKGKSWALIANYKDATMIRNDIAFYIGREMSLLDYTPDSRFAELILNGRYWGVYQVSETIDAAANRVDVGDDGFILEIDGKARYDDVVFHTTRLPEMPFNIKYPETKEGDENYTFARDYVQKAEDALFSDDFLDEERGYRQYIDMPSFVEWYLVNEICKNTDAAFYTSCYFSLARGGKLKMGPVWDFDLAFGNHYVGGSINDPEHCYFMDKGWFARLFEDPSFVSMVKSRFDDYYTNRQKIYDRIDEDCRLLSSCLVWNNKIWGCICNSSSSENDVLSAYRNRIQILKSWIERRMNNLKEEIEKLKF